MRIAIFCKRTTFHSGFGGMETQNKLLCEGLARRGHQIVVFSPSYDVTQKAITENNVSYVFVESSYRYFMAKSNANSWFNKSYPAFKEVHYNTPFDLVVSQSSAGIGIIERKATFGVKVVSIAHGSAMGEFKTFYINHKKLTDMPRLLLNLQYALRQFFGRQRQYVLHSTKVVAVSNAVKAQLTDETFPPEDLITVIHNGVEAFTAPEVKPNAQKKTLRRKVAVYTGQLTVDKGVEQLLELSKDERFHDFDLHLIGGGALLDKAKQVASYPCLGAKLHVHGKLAYADYIKLVPTFVGGLFLFPTKRVEGFPMVLVEAMLAGLVVVAYDIGGTSDAVVNDVTGALVQFNNKETFKNKVLELSSNQDKLVEMSNNARNKALKEFSLNTMLDSYEKLFKEVLK